MAETTETHTREEVSQTPVAGREHPFQKYWRPGAAVVYLATIVFDYIIRPLLNNRLGKDFDLALVVKDIQGLDPNAQIKAMEIAAQVGKIAPILPEYYHLAFGAILGAAAWTRGQEKMERVKKGMF